jgi:hypothetical protein
MIMSRFFARAAANSIVKSAGKPARDATKIPPAETSIARFLLRENRSTHQF